MPLETVDEKWSSSSGVLLGFCNIGMSEDRLDQPRAQDLPIYCRPIRAMAAMRSSMLLSVYFSPSAA